MKQQRNFLGRFFQGVADLLNGAERSFLDLLSILVPYAVPIIPAYLTYYHTTGMMGFPSWVAWTAAFVVEVLGIVAVSTTIRFWRNNTLYKSEKEQAPVWLAAGTYVFYIVIVLSVNVLLEVTSGVRSPAVIWAIALFSLLSVPSGVLISIRAQYTEMLEDRTERRIERQAERQEHRQTQRAPTWMFNKDVKQPELQEEPANGNGKFRGKP